MTAVTCPNGHASGTEDYCDTCGEPIGAASPPPVAAESSPPAGTPVTVECPHCATANIADALFCEGCGYDFTTGSLPEPLEPPAGVSVVATAPEASAATPGEAAADPASPTVVPPSAAEDTWVAEIWIDPEWYRSENPEDPLPSGGLPAIVPLTQRTLLVGRPSASRGIVPQIDCGSDSGVSRRHCQLNTDGTRWWVEDLQSSNGTFLSPAGEGLPTDPIPVGQRREVGDGDRIYLGGWTRIVIRQALPGEV